jgi:hypothetical protein
VAADLLNALRRLPHRFSEFRGADLFKVLT